MANEAKEISTTAKGGRLNWLRPSHEHTAFSATLLLMTSTVLSRIIGLVRDMYIAAIFGAGVNTDAYNVAFYLPEWINYFLVGGAASIAFVTILSRYHERGEHEEGERALSIILNMMLVVMGTAIVAAEFLAPWYTRIYFAPGSVQSVLCTQMTRILLPAQLFFFAGGVLASVLLVRKQFSYQAVTPLIYNLGIIAGGVLLGRAMGIQSLALGALGGAIAGPFLLNAIGVTRAGIRYRPVLDLKHPGLREWVRLSVPLMLGVTIVTMDTYILSFVVRHSVGAISLIGYAKRLITAPIAILGQTAGAASMPFFASLYSQGKFKEFAANVNRAVSKVIAASLLLTALLTSLAVPAIDLVLRRRAFTTGDARATAVYFGIFALSLALWSAQAIYARAFYAAGETMTPMVAGTIVTVLSLPIYFALFQWFGLSGAAWASNAAILVHTIALALLLHRRGWVRMWGRDAGGLEFGEIGRAVLAAGVAFAAVTALLHWSVMGTGKSGDLMQLGLGMAVWGACCVCVLKLSGSKLPEQMMAQFMRR